MDERLRALGRSAVHDVEASWARLRALGRSLGRRELFLELCRLARGGDAAAGDALGRWAPLGPAPVGPVEPLAGARWAARTQVVEAAWLDPMSVLAATDELVVGHRGVGQGWGKLVALDPRAPERPRWEADTGGMVAWRGDDLVHATPRSGRGATLGVRDAATGEVVGKTAVERVWSLAVSGDRAVVKSGERGAQARFSVLDLAPDAFGRALWSREAPFTTEAHLAGAHLLLLGDEDVRGLALETGEVVWRRLGADLGNAGTVMLEQAQLFADARGGVLHAPGLSVATLLALDAATGATAWSHVEPGLVAAVGPGRVLVAHPHGGQALDRATGEAAWACPAGRQVPAARVGPAVVAVAGALEAQVSLALFDAADGRPLSETFVERRGTPVLGVLATESSAVLAASTPGRLTLVRAGAAPGA